jgi:conjugative transfer signal peptidase TraF
MTGRSAVLVAMALSIVAIGATAGTKPAPRFLWNVSASVPTGLYRVRPARDLAVATLVVAYPPEPLATWLAEGHYLPHGVPLLKRVLALEGQTVCRIGPVIWVDGREVGTARKQDHSGRPLPVWHGCRVIGHDEVFLMNTDEPASLDGRYFGPLPLAAIVGLAEPIWTSAEDRSGGFDTAPMPVSGRDARAPTTLHQVGKCRPAFHVHHSRGEHHGPHDAHHCLRSDGRSEDHARADLAPIRRRTMGVLDIGPAPAAGPPKRRGRRRFRTYST